MAQNLANSADIRAFLTDYPEEIAALAEHLRVLIKETVPNCSETLHSGWKVISYGHTKRFCAIAPHSKWLNLQFHNGAALPDADSLLVGTGKSMRHVKLYVVADLTTSLRTLIQTAAAPIQTAAESIQTAAESAQL